MTHFQNIFAGCVTQAWLHVSFIEFYMAKVVGSSTEIADCRRVVAQVDDAERTSGN